MQKIRTFSCKCLLIKPDDTITPMVLAFDEYFSKKSATNYQMARDNMIGKYQYYYYVMNFLYTPFPDHSYYSLFYQSTYSNEKKINRIATKIVGNSVYGEAIVIHFNNFEESCDIDCETFVKTYNAKNTSKKIIYRDIVKFEANKIEKK